MLCYYCVIFFCASGPSGYFTRQWRRWRSSVSLVQLHLVKALAVWLHRNNDILRWFQNALTVTFNWGAYTDPAVGTKLEARAAWLRSRPLWHAATCNAKPYIAWPSLTLLAASINEIFRKKHLRTLQLAQGRSCFSGFGHRSSWKAGPVRPAVDSAVGQVPGGRADGNSVLIGMSWDVLALGDMVHGAGRCSRGAAGRRGGLDLWFDTAWRCLEARPCTDPLAASGISLHRLTLGPWRVGWRAQRSFAQFELWLVGKYWNDTFGSVLKGP